MVLSLKTNFGATTPTSAMLASVVSLIDFVNAFTALLSAASAPSMTKSPSIFALPLICNPVATTVCSMTTALSNTVS